MTMLSDGLGAGAPPHLAEGQGADDPHPSQEIGWSLRRGKPISHGFFRLGFWWLLLVKRGLGLRSYVADITPTVVGK